MSDKPPRADSLRALLLAFFEANPDEELTRNDIRIKFRRGGGERSTGAMDHALMRLRREGILEAVHVYRLKQRGRPE